ncbi:hypothetical protein [Tepidimonas taiwanensis]|uniref:hypothetical protein n=1 Tax=Tepidimonas taiwanensis TaxID=307486 RepID=UPI0005BB307C|nr:hypothetical protein [Tepidimonas taiwanensis]
MIKEGKWPYLVVMGFCLWVLWQQWRAGLLTREHWRAHWQEMGGWWGLAITVAVVALMLVFGIAGVLLLIFLWGALSVLLWLIRR